MLKLDQEFGEKLDASGSFANLKALTSQRSMRRPYTSSRSMRRKPSSKLSQTAPAAAAALGARLYHRPHLVQSLGM